MNAGATAARAERPRRSMTTIGKIGLVLALVGAAGGVYAVKKATLPMTLRDLPELARVPAPPLGAVSHEATLEEEQRLVYGAQAALESRDTNRAFSLLYEHATRFPKGKLTPERQVTHLVTLCRAGKVVDARHELAEFLTNNPLAPLAAEVQGMRCAE